MFVVCCALCDARCLVWCSLRTVRCSLFVGCMFVVRCVVFAVCCVKCDVLCVLCVVDCVLFVVY